MLDRNRPEVISNFEEHAGEKVKIERLALASPLHWFGTELLARTGQRDLLREPKFEGNDFCMYEGGIK